jgi:hypothetical protein
VRDKAQREQQQREQAEREGAQREQVIQFMCLSLLCVGCAFIVGRFLLLRCVCRFVGLPLLVSPFDTPLCAWLAAVGDLRLAPAARPGVLLGLLLFSSSCTCTVCV